NPPLRSGLADHRGVSPLADFNPLTGNKVVRLGPLLYNSVHLVNRAEDEPFEGAGHGWKARVYDRQRYGQPGWNLQVDIVASLEDNGELVVYDGFRTPLVYRLVGDTYYTREFSSTVVKASGRGFVITYGNGNGLFLGAIAEAAPIPHGVVRMMDKLGNRTDFVRDGTGRIDRIEMVGVDEAAAPPNGVTELGWDDGLLAE